jgi:hypothetical protein
LHNFHQIEWDNLLNPHPYSHVWNCGHAWNCGRQKQVQPTMSRVYLEREWIREKGTRQRREI